MVATLAVGEPVESVSLFVSTTVDPFTSYRAAIDAALTLILFEDGSAVCGGCSVSRQWPIHFRFNN